MNPGHPPFVIEFEASAGDERTRSRDKIMFKTSIFFLILAIVLLSGTTAHSAISRESAVIAGVGTSSTEFIIEPVENCVITWGGAGWYQANGIAVDERGDIYIAGRFKGKADLSPGPDKLKRESVLEYYDSCLVKLDPSGGFLWASTWGGRDWDEAYDVEIDSQGNIYVVGDHKGFTDFMPGDGEFVIRSLGLGFDSYLMKFNPSGDVIWVKTWGGIDFDKARGVAIGPDGGIYITGSFKGFADFNPGGEKLSFKAAGSADSYLMKVDPSGEFVWAKTWGGDDWDEASGVAVSAAGIVYVTGFFSETIDLDPGPDVAEYSSRHLRGDSYLVSLGGDGEYRWAKTWGGDDWDTALGVAIGAGDDIYVVGDFKSRMDLDPGTIGSVIKSNGDIDSYLIKLSAEGALLWARAWGGTEQDSAGGVVLTSDGSVFAVGSFYGTVDFDPGVEEDLRSSAGDFNSFLMKFDSEGNLSKR